MCFRFAAVALGALALLSCAPRWEVPGAPPGLHAQNPGLEARIRESPHGLFRFVNRPFADEVCRALADDPGPIVNLHGDAHIEQYAITDRGRGLTDFDDAARGPAAIDLVRFSSSLILTCAANDYPCEPVIDAFWRAYTDELSAPDGPQREPAVVTRARSHFVQDRRQVFQRREELFEPLPDAERFDHLLFHYRKQMIRKMPTLPLTFFEDKRVGRLQIGVGSALDEKYLVRIEGQSESDDDDLFLEIKEVRDLSGVRCLSPADFRSPLRVIIGQRRLAYSPYELAGFVVIEPLAPNALPTAFWVHEWADNYVETLHDSFSNRRDLLEVASDVGIQLGLGHPRNWKSTQAESSRQALQTWLSSHRPQLQRLAEHMAAAVTKSWHERI